MFSTTATEMNFRFMRDVHKNVSTASKYGMMFQERNLASSSRLLRRMRVLEHDSLPGERGVE
jgi:hypothetical protein